MAGLGMSSESATQRHASPYPLPFRQARANRPPRHKTAAIRRAGRKGAKRLDSRAAMPYKYEIEKICIQNVRRPR
jgi:hypothetical protein